MEKAFVKFKGFLLHLIVFNLCGEFLNGKLFYTIKWTIVARYLTVSFGAQC